MLHPAEFAGLYIILFIQKVFPHPKSWLGSGLKIPVKDSMYKYAPSDPPVEESKRKKIKLDFLRLFFVIFTAEANLLNIPVLFSDKERAKITRCFGAIKKDPTVVNLYRYFSLNSIPHYVNEFIVNWGKIHYREHFPRILK